MQCNHNLWVEVRERQDLGLRKASRSFELPKTGGAGCLGSADEHTEAGRSSVGGFTMESPEAHQG